MKENFKRVLGLKVEKTKRVGLQIKLTIVFTLLLVLLSIFNFSLNYTQSFLYLNEALEEQLLSIARTSLLQINSQLIEDYIKNTFEDENDNKLLWKRQLEILQNIRSRNNLQSIYILAKKGDFASTIMEVGKNLSYQKNRNLDKDLISAFSGKEVSTKHLISEAGVITKTAYYPLRNSDGKIFAVLGIDAESQAIIKLVNKIKKQTILFLFFSLLISLLVSMIVATAITTPIKQLLFATGRVTKGDLSSDVKIKNLWGIPYRDEIGELSISFNEMIRSLREKYEENKILYDEIKTLNIDLERKIKEATFELEERNKQLMEREEERLQELKLAQQAQKVLLPTSYSSHGVRIESKFIPAKELGGDFYNFIAIDDTHLGIVIGDVTGKGVAAGLFMAMVVGILYESSKKTISPSEILSKANSTIYSHIEMDSDFFASAFYGVFDTSSKTFTYSKAGHEKPILFRKEDERIHILDAKGLFLGAFSDAEFEEKKIHLQPGDKIIFYTDGLYEAKNEKGDFFGEERIFKILKENAHLSASEIIDKIYHHLLLFISNKSLSDDLALVVLEIEK